MAQEIARYGVEMQVPAKAPLLQVNERFEHEIEKISGSRFIATLVPVETAEQMLVHQQALRALHPHARHVCFAYVGSAETATRHSDDGEPAKTAGVPMLRVLLGASLRNTGVLVVRYFGGVKLGTGGLVRAYTHAVREVLERAPLKPVATVTSHTTTLAYADEPRVRHWCEKYGVAFEVVQFGATELTAILSGELAHVQRVLARAALK